MVVPIAILEVVPFKPTPTFALNLHFAPLIVFGNGLIGLLALALQTVKTDLSW